MDVIVCRCSHMCMRERVFNRSWQCFEVLSRPIVYNMDEALIAFVVCAEQCL